MQVACKQLLSLNMAKTAPLLLHLIDSDVRRVLLLLVGCIHVNRHRFTTRNRHEPVVLHLCSIHKEALLRGQRCPMVLCH
jgi:hypothetical protein